MCLLKPSSEIINVIWSCQPLKRMPYSELGPSFFYNHIPMQFISFLPYIATGHMSFPNVPDVTGAEQMNSYYVKRAQVTNIREKIIPLGYFPSRWPCPNTFDTILICWRLRKMISILMTITYPLLMDFHTSLAYERTLRCVGSQLF